MASESLCSRFPKAKTDAADPRAFINRELSALEFSSRVLHEALDPATPLLERLRFLSILVSNLDEFFMVRVARLKSRIEAGAPTRCPTGLSLDEQFRAISRKAHSLVTRAYRGLDILLPLLDSAGISILKEDALPPEQKAEAAELFHSQIYPVLTPLAVEPSGTFPLLMNLSMNFAVRFKSREDGDRMAVVQVPPALPRLLELGSDPGRTFVLMESVIAAHLGDLFAGRPIASASVFRITRDSDLELDEEGGKDFIHVLEEEVRKRRSNEPVRLEIEASAPQSVSAGLQRRLQLLPADVYRVGGPLDLRGLAFLCDLAGFDSLRYPLMPPNPLPELVDQSDIFSVAARKDLLFHHPYDAFEPVVELLRRAAADPDVLAIKQTLYRTSGNSPVVHALEAGVLNGKQVTVLLELTARFDEERNIGWARRLEQAGAHVVYGLAGLKTHSKILLVVRREPGGIQRYVHLSTGNYNDRTARQYTDIGLLTSDKAFGSDASAFFNTITGFSDPPVFERLVMAPFGMRERFLSLIGREAKRAREGQRAVIRAKMNSLVDVPVVLALYEASQAGAEIELCVRGPCVLRPGVSGISDRIRVVSVVDRFLEHSRIFYFYNGGHEEVYLSSADWMPRNLDRRVELLFPVVDPDARARVLQALDLILRDNVKSWDLQPNGSYIRNQPRGEKAVRAQYRIHELARTQAAKRLQESHLEVRPIEP